MISEGGHSHFEASKPLNICEAKIYERGRRLVMNS